MNYKLLFQRAVPNLTFKYGDTNIVYTIEYLEIKDNNDRLTFQVDLQRVEDNIRVTVVRRVLLSLLFTEMREIITKYMGMSKWVDITVQNDLEEGI
jgi:hypothetical protein